MHKEVNFWAESMLEKQRSQNLFKKTRDGCCYYTSCVHPAMDKNCHKQEDCIKCCDGCSTANVILAWWKVTGKTFRKLV